MALPLFVTSPFGMLRRCRATPTPKLAHYVEYTCRSVSDLRTPRPRGELRVFCSFVLLHFIYMT